MSTSPATKFPDSLRRRRRAAASPHPHGRRRSTQRLPRSSSLPPSTPTNYAPRPALPRGAVDLGNGSIQLPLPFMFDGPGPTPLPEAPITSAPTPTDTSQRPQPQYAARLRERPEWLDTFDPTGILLGEETPLTGRAR